MQSLTRRILLLPEGGHAIPSLDGLRAIAVLFVVLGHSQAWRLRFAFIQPLRDGGLGVTIFFVISGFLITQLLLRDLNETGQVRLKRFYIKRAFRIFPPFYAYLAVVGVLVFLNLDPLPLYSMLSAATFTWNYSLDAEGWRLAHLWSLSLEEQFYLFWPLCMRFFSKQINLRIAIVAICLAPFIRFFSFKFVPAPAFQEHIGMMLHSRIDTIMLGCLLALVLDLNLWPKLVSLGAHAAVLLLAAGYMFFAHAYLFGLYKNLYQFALGITLQGISALVLVMYSTSKPRSPLGILLNNPLAQFIGVLSYGVYLWQQSLTGPFTVSFPQNLALILVCALVSYYFVETPARLVRDRILRGVGRTSRVADVEQRT